MYESKCDTLLRGLTQSRMPKHMRTKMNDAEYSKGFINARQGCQKQLRIAVIYETQTIAMELTATIVLVPAQ